jgi:DNA-binding NarL/FixJ family response regulator
MKTARILLADDHRMVAEGLKTLLQAAYEVVGVAEDGRSLLTLAEQTRPDVIVADVSMPLLNGIDATIQLKRIGSRAKVVFLTMHPDVAYAARAFEAGASGYVLKHSAPTELLEAVKQVLRGGTYVTPRLSEELIRFRREGAAIATDPSSPKLTVRQREVLQLLAEGRSAKEVASVLKISPRTAEFHKYRLMEELRVKTSAELIQFAIRTGVI